FRSLKPLTETEVEQLMASIPITPALRDVIKDMAGGHPALLQIAGSLLFRGLRTGKLPDTETFAKEFEDQTRHIFQDIWQRCRDFEQGLLILMAWSKLKDGLEQKITVDLSNIDLTKIDVIFSQHQRELTNLVEQGVIIDQDQEQLGNGRYSFASLGMEQWVIQVLQTSDKASLEQWQTILLKLINP
ncbi:MAG: ATP-binding protein, partial [Moorea sp. SIO2I5]|nr:ATP-binding protein [Moorena sp. SIO2I5]